jgi:hypothetical protein
MAGSVAKRKACSLYDVTMVMGSTRVCIAKQMQLRYAQLTDENFTAFA